MDNSSELRRLEKLDFLDIVFEHKNKSYGAYVIRKSYDRNLSIAVVIGLLFISLSFIIPFIIKKACASREGTKKMEQKKIISYTELSAPPPIEVIPPPPPQIKVPKKKVSVKYLPPVAKKDEMVPDEEIIPTQDELKHVEAGTAIIEADDSVYFDAGDAEVTPEPEPEQPFLFVQQMPEFPGGEAALLDYFSSNIRYPEMAREHDIEGTVYVQFVIDPEGNVTKIKVLRGVGAGCDKEAVRVIASMPKWKAGKHGDRFVPVMFTVPIQFKLN